MGRGRGDSPLYQLEANAVDKTKGSPVVTLYLSAAFDAFGYANTTLEEDKKPLLYCQPSDLALNTLNLRQMLGSRITRNKADVSASDWNAYIRIMNVAGELLGLLQETFPCKN